MENNTSSKQSAQNQKGLLLSILRPFLGWLLIILGIFGLVLPILQGWLFLALGAFFLSPDIPLFARIFYWIERRYPNIQKTTKHINKIFLNRGDQSLPPSPFNK